MNGVFRSVLNFLLFFFYKKISQAQKSTKPLTANKNKNMHKKHLRGKKLLTCLLAYLLLLGSFFMLLVRFSAFCACKILS